MDTTQPPTCQKAHCPNPPDMLCPFGRCADHCACAHGIVDGHGEPDDDDTDLMPDAEPDAPIIIESAD